MIKLNFKMTFKENNKKQKKNLFKKLKLLGISNKNTHKHRVRECKVFMRD